MKKKKFIGHDTAGVAESLGLTRSIGPTGLTGRGVVGGWTRSPEAVSAVGAFLVHVHPKVYALRSSRRSDHTPTW